MRAIWAGGAGVGLAAVLALVALSPAPLHSQEKEATEPRLPVGSIVAWHAFGGPTQAPPPGWQLCDGSEITDPEFVRRFGPGRHAPNLNGHPKPASGKNPGQPAFLRGARTSPADGYGGADSAPHRHDLADHVHGLASHTHGQHHTHGMSHQHAVGLSTDTAGGFGRGGDGGGLRSTAERHSHSVRGTTQSADNRDTQGPSRGQTEGPSTPSSAGPSPAATGLADPPTLPRHFSVTWIVKVR